MQNRKIIFFVVLVVLILAIALTVFLRSNSEEISSTKYDAFAQCLAEKQLTMYGTYWCSYCKKEKEAFGSSFKYVPYVECTENTNACLEKDIKGYPTWIDAAGNKYQGIQGLEKLSEISGCPLPIE